MNRRVRILFLLFLCVFSLAVPVGAMADDAPSSGSSGGSSSSSSSLQDKANRANEIYAMMADSTSTINMLGVNLFEEGIDRVIFKTNQFVSDATFIGKQGPFWWIMQMCMGLAALFSIIVAAGMAYRMMLKGEPFDPMKLIRILGIAMVMFFWYPGTTFSGTEGCFLDLLAYIPNALGSYTHELYSLEAEQVADKFKSVCKSLDQEQANYIKYKGEYEPAAKAIVNGAAASTSTSTGASGTSASQVAENQAVADAGADVAKSLGSSGGQQSTAISPDGKGTAQANASASETAIAWAGMMLLADRVLLFLAILLFRIGWWSMIFCQQVILGMLTIFGPLQWAFSILPKWEGAWAKWLIRYLTVHLYGAMMYFVGFYVLLLFDIVLSIQLEDLQRVVDSGAGFLHNGMLTAGYLLVASIVALKCLNLAPDLASWMIPEGESSFSTRNFGEGISSEVNQKGMGFGRMLM